MTTSLGTTAHSGPVHYNPYAHEVHDDPFPFYARLRREAPVYRNDDLGFWALSRHADVLDAFHDHEHFSSAGGITLEQNPQFPMLITTDPPQHTKLRRLVSRAFTPRRVADLEPAIRTRATDFLDVVSRRGEAELIDDYAGKLPMHVICRMLGTPHGDEDQLRGWSDLLLHREEGIPDVTPAGIEASIELYRYFVDLVREKHATPGDDLTSALLAAELDGERLTDQDVIGFCFLLIIAGNETTTKLIGNALLALQRFPAERAKLLADPARIPDAIEEVLRFDGSTQVMARTLTTDVTRHDITMPAGDKVLLLIGSANHDETVFDRPDVFDIDRDKQLHLGFGHGIHVCLGAALARLEMRVSLEEILARMPDYVIDEDRLVRVHSGNVRGFAHMPIAWSRA
ncbi:MAG TPA: cytochrome P450 [Acidimicrobiia bacterium]|nr:cytochrome P450 [Acidimicrobiia bacterium]